MSEIFNAVLGTAGHIDHGKSTLVQALTGINPDRLPEEQDRGITIDLGFAPMTLKNGLRVGIIDVPGHERFIKNMVAGASGIDFVILVVAADDGVMAQTREHLQIIQLLGVRDGLTVITKKDLVEIDYLSLVIDDIKSLVAGTVLDAKPVVPVSSKTGDGLTELKQLLETALSKLTRRSSAGPFRMPIQRVFAKEGFGTVVTGVPLTGRVKPGDILQILPGGFQGRVKGLHAYSHAIEHGQAGHSTAINLIGAEIDKQRVTRGMTVATPELFKPSSLLTARLDHLQSARWPLKHRAPVRFHSGTAEIQGKVLLLDGDQLPAGVSGWIQISLEEPVTAVPGDRFILRHQTPMVTLGGGRLVDVAPHKRKRQQPAVIAELERRFKSLDQPPEFLATLLESDSIPRTVRDLCAETGLLSDQLLSAFKPLESAKRAVALQPGVILASRLCIDSFNKALLVEMDSWFKEHAALGSVDRLELRKRLQNSIGHDRVEFFDILLDLAKSSGVVSVDSNQISLPRRERKLEGALAETAARAEAIFKAGGLGPPTPAEVAAQLKVMPKQFREILKFLTETGRLIEAAPDLCLHHEPFERAKLEVVKLLSERGECTTSEIRQHLGTNRKYVVPFVETLDRHGITIRVGDKRKINQK